MSEAPPQEQSLHRLVRFVGPTTLVQPVLSFCISVIIARSLGPEGRGAYGVVVTAIVILPAVVGLGLESAVRYWSARGEVNPSSLLRTASLLACAAGTAMAGIALASWWHRFPESIVPPALGPAGAAALAAALFLSALNVFWTNYLAGHERYGYGTWGMTAGTALQAATLAAIWRLSEVSLDAATGVLALQLGFSFMLFLALAGRELLRALRAPLLGLAELKEMLRYGSWLYLSGLLALTNMRLNIFLLAALSNFYETGLYTAVLGPAYFLASLGAPLRLVLSARTTRRTDDASFPPRVAGALRLILVISLAAAGLAAAVAPAVLPWIFGERFADAVLPFQILLPGIVAISLVSLINQYLAGAKRPRWSTAIAATGAVLTAVLNVALIPKYGARGAALATSLAFLVSMGVAVYAFLRVSGLGALDLVAFRASDWVPLGRVLSIALTRRSGS